MKRKLIDAHIKHGCPNQKIECDECHQQILRGNAKQHLETCQEVIIECQQCKSKFKRKDEAQHNCVQSLLKIIEDLKIDQ